VKNVVVVDYGAGNIKSVQRGLEEVGASVSVSSDPELIANADRLILPGVGAFEDGMHGLKKANLIPAIIDFVTRGNPLLGICLGMQMLLDQSEEHGSHEGLKLIPGKVVDIPDQAVNGAFRKIPHIGWSSLLCSKQRNSWQGTIMGAVPEKEYVYFVHSYMAVPEFDEHLIAQCVYEELRITAVIQKDNIIGFQFHPEKSGEAGLELLHKFMNI